ncbi:MAG: PHP domain-containing protein [Acidobacteriota bacterium]
MAAACIAFAQTRDPLPVPDLPGYKTLKADFHMHTVFSDGEVWPATRVTEAWRDGLDVIAITDHYTYNPHYADVKVDVARPYEIARAAAGRTGIIVISGVEIMQGDLHTNALFMRDANAVLGLDFLSALREANKQGAFVQWNHPGWKAPLKEPIPPLTTAFGEKLIQGVEIVNGPDYYADAHPWTEANHLALTANSDIHAPITAEYAPRKRPVTLVFAKTRDAAGVRDALFARRTAGWMNDQLWGAEEYLRGIWQAAVTVEPSTLQFTAKARGSAITLRNTSGIPFKPRVGKTPDWLYVEAAEVPAERIAAMHVSIAKTAPAGSHRVNLELEITNLHTGPGRNLIVRLPVEISIEP